MAKGNSKEEKYKQLMIDMGTYHPAFDSTIDDLARKERDRSRAQKEWRATVQKPEKPSIQHPIHKIIREMDKEILTLRSELGFTKKGLDRLLGKASKPAESVPSASTSNPAFGKLLDAMKENACGSGT